jgi:hypothetical protein
LDGDFDPDGDMLAALRCSDPLHGSLTLYANGSFTYTPQSGFVGEDTFTYQLTDGQDLSAPATVTITVSATPNRPPEAEGDQYQIDEDTILRVLAPGVLENDQDPDGNLLTAQLVQGPTNGQLTFNPATGQFSYRGFANFHGQDSFTYRAFDGELYSEPAEVTITVNAVNDAPIAGDDIYTMTQNAAGNASLTIGVPGLLENDTDVEGQSLTAVKVTDPSNGVVTINPDGSFTYTPNPGFVGEDSFTYEAFDGLDSSVPATVTITVQPSTGAPPVVESVLIEDGATQRSMVTQLTITFNTVVSYSQGSFRLENKNTGAAIVGWTLTDVSSVDKTILEMEFPANAGFTGDSLADGNYLLTILAQDITAAGRTLDGDGDGSQGGDYQFGATDEFFRFFGDSNGDRYVNGGDLGVFRGSYPKTSAQPGYLWYFDYDADNDVDRDDYLQFVDRYRTRYLAP